MSTGALPSEMEKLALPGQTCHGGGDEGVGIQFHFGDYSVCIGMGRRFAQ
jgi:hypothetical protein